MKFVLLTIVFLLSSEIYAQEPLIRMARLEPNIVRASGVSDAVFSSDGRFLALQAPAKFAVLPVQNLYKNLENPIGLREYEGKVVGFLPSNALIFLNRDGVFTLDPLRPKPKRLFTPAVGKQLIDDFDLRFNSVVIVSNDLIITGDGSYDWGGEMGNIFRYDLKRRRMTRAARVPMFWYASLAPSKAFILYEHGAEDNNNAELYDILRNRNYAIANYLYLKKHFPEFKETDEAPIAWLDGRDRFLATVEATGEYGNDERVWLALFDVPARRMIWKTVLEKLFFPTDFQQMDEDKALFVADDTVFELSLRNGMISKHPNIGGKSIAVNPDRKTIAFVTSTIICRFTGREQQKIDLQSPVGLEAVDRLQSYGRTAADVVGRWGSANFIW